MTKMEHPAGHVLQAYHDGELAPDRAAAVEAHCDRCAECRSVLDELAAAERLLAAVPAPEMQRSVWSRVDPGRARESRFRPAFALAAGAVGIVIGVLMGPVPDGAGDARETSTWTATVGVWSSGTTSSLLDVFETGQD